MHRYRPRCSPLRSKPLHPPQPPSASRKHSAPRRAQLPLRPRHHHARTKPPPSSHQKHSAPRRARRRVRTRSPH
ncbi:hypothetical protein D7X12_37465, partial [Corallococcus sicarius]